jgi:hypothetical protein
MSIEEKYLLVEHARGWAEFGPQVEAMRARELHEESEDDHRRAIAEVLAGPIEWFSKGSRPDSGLVEQQRIFAKLRQTGV